MPDAIKVMRLSLKCDACDHREPIADISEDMIGRRCPACGADMLTRGDFDAARMQMAAIAMLNAAVGPVSGNEYGPPIKLNPRAGSEGE